MLYTMIEFHQELQEKITQYIANVFGPSFELIHWELDTFDRISLVVAESRDEGTVYVELEGHMAYVNKPKENSNIMYIVNALTVAGYEVYTKVDGQSILNIKKESS